MLQVYLLPSFAVELHFRNAQMFSGRSLNSERAGFSTLIAFPGSDIRLGVSDIQGSSPDGRGPSGGTALPQSSGRSAGSHIGRAKWRH
jgi:hypothetical protein